MHRWWWIAGSGLQTRMTLSYVWVTALTIIFLESLNAVLFTLIGSAGRVSPSISQLLYSLPLHGGEPAQTLYLWLQAIFVIGQVLVLAPLIGGLFGTMTTRGIVRRVRQLASATAQIAHGNYAQRVRMTRNDEIGQLEAQFNRMAEQLADSLAQRQELAGENARLAERTRISRELHDAISQDLFSLRMLSDGLHMALQEDSPLQPRVALLEQTTTRMIREMRALLLEMRPTQLDQLGLSAALEDLAAGYRERLGITITTTIATLSLAARLEHALLRVAQEALANAVRHADATKITLNLAPQADMITLAIADNGKGFTADESSTLYGLGLHLMQERIQELHGNFLLESVPNQGTRIHVCLPQEIEDVARADRR